MESRWDDQASNSQCQKTGSGLGNNLVEFLFDPVHTTKEEAHAHDEQQIGKYTANQRGLNNRDFVLIQSDDGDNELDCVSETGVQQTTEGFSGS